MAETAEQRAARELAAQPWSAIEARLSGPDADLFAEASIGGVFRRAFAGSPREFWFARKSGVFTALNEGWLKPAPKNWKRPVGALLNRLRAAAETHFAAASAPAAATREWERLDITLPGRRRLPGASHPVLQVRDEITGIFLRLGYTVADGPEIETPYYNFEALNIPEGHPAREEQDTLYLAPPPEPADGAGQAGPYLLRTHTSPVQIHTMERQPPPLRVIVPGKVYRRDAPDATHSPNFHQMEGLAVDTDLHFGDLRGTLDHFARQFFGPAVRTRLRPSYFQFTEPSAELDVSCIFCEGRGCRTCKQSGWIEVLGCGMVDPAVFGFVHIDPERFSGFAFGMGVERLAMIRYEVEDIQRFYSGDLRFLEQFR